MSDTVQTILYQIEKQSITLPTFQRGYVWNRDQVRSLMQSLYRRYPIGSLLVWETSLDPQHVKGNAPAPVVHLLLDGQQRMTTLYGIINGYPPPFFEDDDAKKTFSDLYFHVGDENFEFYAPVKMKDDPLWVSVTHLMQAGPVPAAMPLQAMVAPDAWPVYLQRLDTLSGIKDVQLHAEKVIGGDKSIDVVVDIFNRVNSGGTKLSKGDLALARVCAQAPVAREMMHDRLREWKDAGFVFTLDWLLRNITTILTGKANFSALVAISPDMFFDGLARAEKHCNYLLNMIGDRLGLDHDRVLAGKGAFPVMAAYLDHQLGGRVPEGRDRDRLLYWYVQSFLRGRFTGATETAMNQDLTTVEEAEDAIGGLIGRLEAMFSTLRIRPEDFAGSSVGARFYPLLYLLTRVYGARDWGTGHALKTSLLGRGSTLHVHHIFPKAQLYRAGYHRAEVNAVANFCLLTQETNLAISDALPEEYFPRVEPASLESQWIPSDPALWTVDRYPDFLDERRRLLAGAANSFFDGLLQGQLGGQTAEYATSTPAAMPVAQEIDADLLGLTAWCDERHIPAPLLDHEIADPASGEPLALADAAWPAGVQIGLSDPVALVRDSATSRESRLQELSYRLFRTIPDLQTYLSATDGTSGAGSGV